jgi:hypothetical protein
MRRILPVIEGRDENEPLLLRWGYRKTGGPGNWTKDKRQAWRRADEIDELWAKTSCHGRASRPIGVICPLRSAGSSKGFGKRGRDGASPPISLSEKFNQT